VSAESPPDEHVDRHQQETRGGPEDVALNLPQDLSYASGAMSPPPKSDSELRQGLTSRAAKLTEDIARLTSRAERYERGDDRGMTYSYNTPDGMKSQIVKQSAARLRATDLPELERELAEAREQLEALGPA